MPSGNAESDGQIGHRLPVKVVGEEQGALVDGQSVEGGVEVGRTDGTRVEVGLLEVGGHRDLAHAPAAGNHPRGVDGYRAQPRVEVVGVTQRAQRAPGGEERFLGRVACVGAVAQDADRRPVHRIDPRARELIEGVGITRPSTLDELAVHPPSDLRSHLRRCARTPLGSVS